jgi:DNA-binding GntR family transcriptional regulator
VYEELRERLVSGHYRHGDRISVEVLRGEFSVSKQPVMEALRLLSADGLVQIIPQVGSVVASYPEQEIGDFFDMFAGFEGAIAAAAARRRTDAQLRELDAASQRISVLVADPDPQVRARQYRVLNRDFHRVIHDMAGSRVMAETSRRMWDLSDFLINTAGAPQPLSSATGSRHDEHESIREAIAASDAEKARSLMEFHIRETVDVIRAEASTAATSITGRRQ